MKFAVLASLVLSSASADFVPVGYSMVEGFDMPVLKEGLYGSRLFAINEPSIELGTGFFLDLHGPSRELMGFDQGFLIGDKIYACFQAMMEWLTGGDQSLAALVEGALTPCVSQMRPSSRPLTPRFAAALLMWQWEIALSKQTPQDFLDELTGMTAGGTAAGVPRNVGDLAAMAMVLSNFPGSAADFVYVLVAELPLAKRAQLEAALEKAGTSTGTVEAALAKVRWLHSGCSNFGAWGGRTQGGDLFSGRNLDYSKDTGINQFKLVTVYHPPGKIAHGNPRGRTCTPHAPTPWCPHERTPTSGASHHD